MEKIISFCVFWGGFLYDWVRSPQFIFVLLFADDCENASLFVSLDFIVLCCVPLPIVDQNRFF